MKLFNYIIQHKYDYLDNLIVDGDYSMTEEDEKDYKLIGESNYKTKDSSHYLRVHHSQNRYSSGPFTIVEIETDSYFHCDTKILNHHSLKDIITWHKWKVKHNV